MIRVIIIMICVTIRQSHNRGTLYDSDCLMVTQITLLWELPHDVKCPCTSGSHCGTALGSTGPLALALPGCQASRAWPFPPQVPLASEAHSKKNSLQGTVTESAFIDASLSQLSKLSKAAALAGAAAGAPGGQPGISRSDPMASLLEQPSDSTPL